MHNSFSDMKLESSEQNVFNEYWILNYIGIVICIILASYSPLIAFYAGTIFLLVCSQYLDRKAVKWIGYVCAYAGSVMAASRKTFADSDDFSHYYDAYLSILKDGWQVVFEPYGTEIGLPAYYFVLSKLGIESQIYPLFAVALLGSGLFVFWLEKYGAFNFPPDRFGTVMASSLIFYGFMQASLISRQMMSLSIVLIAVSSAGWRSIIWLFTAILFHQSSLLIFILFKYAKKLTWLTATLVICSGIIFMLFFNKITEVAVASNVDFIRVVSKFAYYTTSEESFTGPDLSGLKFVSLTCLAGFLAYKFMPKGWGLLILIVVVLYILLLPFPLISLRTFLIFVAVLAGYIAAFMAFRIGWPMFSWLTTAYAFYTILKQFHVEEGYPFQLWDKFDWIGNYPLYYFLN